MPTTPFDFQNARGQTLSGRLETDGAPAAWAVFAHCFSCGKSSRAAVHLSRALAAEGVGVLRFDFTGLEDSEGEFARGISADAEDLNAAAAAMRDSGRPVRLLVGHSFGGAACLAAAPDIGDVKAVATVGAPFDAGHVLQLVPEALRGGAGSEPAEFQIAGRTLKLAPGFAADLAAHDHAARIADLNRALLILHSPQDRVVGIDNAAEIFRAARHPKSFVSLDGADHLLTGPDDAGWAGRIIAAWFGRYGGSPAGA